MIADKIMDDDNREQIIKKNKYDKAIKHYLYMTLYLVSDYDLRDTYNALREVDFGFTNFDQTKAGHGRVLYKNETA